MCHESWTPWRVLEFVRVDVVREEPWSLTSVLSQREPLRLDKKKQAYLLSVISFQMMDYTAGISSKSWWFNPFLSYHFQYAAVFFAASYLSNRTDDAEGHFTALCASSVSARPTTNGRIISAPNSERRENPSKKRRNIDNTPRFEISTSQCCQSSPLNVKFYQKRWGRWVSRVSTPSRQKVVPLLWRIWKAQRVHRKSPPPCCLGVYTAVLQPGWCRSRLGKSVQPYRRGPLREKRERGALNHPLLYFSLTYRADNSCPGHL